MTLYEKLQSCPSEEDVKDAYIAALKLKGYQKNLIDIQTKEIWFEAKVGSRVSTYAMFTQLLFYVATALKNGEEIPPFLCVIDSVKAAIMKTETVLPFLQDKSLKIKWGKSASDVTQDALDKVSQFIGTHFVSFNIATHEKEFIEAVKSAIATGQIVRTQITPDNLKQVFDQWIEMIGKEIGGVADEDYALLFFADVMSDGTVSTHDDLTAQLVHKGNKPAFFLSGKLYEIGSAEGYRRFWAIYDRPPKEEYRNYLLERRDSLIPTDERQFKGAYYTPLSVVDKAYNLLSQTLGSNWQKEYFVWDMCCGVGNLESKHSNHRRVFMSTLDAEDVDVMRAAKICVAAERFQYDYLNDDITDDGKIDYTLTNKIPEALQKIIAEAKLGKKKILVLINPPYAEATNRDETAKGGVAKTKISQIAIKEYGKSSNELFTQFLIRIAKEIPTATVAIFSKLKYVNSPNFEDFRKAWCAKYLDGFIVHSKVFDGLKGDFPIGFCIWKTENLGSRYEVVGTRNVMPNSSNVMSSRTNVMSSAVETSTEKCHCEPTMCHPELVSGSHGKEMLKQVQHGSHSERSEESLGKRKKQTDLFVPNGTHTEKVKGVSPEQIRVLNNSSFPTEIQCEVLDKNANPIGSKTFYNLPSEQFLSKWIKRPKANDEEVIPLVNAFSTTTGKKGLSKWSDNAIAYMFSAGNDLQQAANGTALFSSTFNNGHGFYVTKENLWKAAVVFTVRRIVQHTWINDRDQFLQPTADLPQEFIDDCLIWMLFNGSNLTAGADGLEWNGKTWSLVNHFIPFTETEVNAPARFESDFMVQYIRGTGYEVVGTRNVMSSCTNVMSSQSNVMSSVVETSTTKSKIDLSTTVEVTSCATASVEVTAEHAPLFSQEAQAVLDAGRAIWQAFFKADIPHNIRSKYKLGRADAGWYQIRQSLKDLNAAGNSVPVSFADFEAAYKTLTEKLRPQVYEFGFLR